MLPWVVRELTTDTVVGSTRYHDIVAVDRSRRDRLHLVQRKRWQRTHVNTACKLLLLGHAFDTLGCGVVGLRTDNFNFASQRAIEALGAKKDGVMRHHWRDATAPRAIRSSTAFWRASGRTCGGIWSLRLARHHRDAP